jgi:hypothetical protein
MKKIKMIVELEYDDAIMHGENKDSRNWFIVSVLGASGKDPDARLILHSQHLGDEVGTIELISLLPDA